MNNRQYIYGHTSPETAYVVDDYPWGFRLRTTIRYWIESKPGKVGGQRFMSQTINPKTGLWCKPKAGIYYEVIVLYLDENKHVKHELVYINDERGDVECFSHTHWDKLDDFQRDQMAKVTKWMDLNDRLEWSCTDRGIHCKIKEAV